MEKYTVNISFIACNVCSAGFGDQLSTVLLCGLRSGYKSLLRVTMFHSLCTDLNTGYVRQQRLRPRYGLYKYSVDSVSDAGSFSAQGK